MFDAGSVCVQTWVYGLCTLMGSAEGLLDDLSLTTVSVGFVPVGLTGAGSDPSGALLKILPCCFTPKRLFRELPLSLCFKSGICLACSSFSIAVLLLLPVSCVCVKTHSCLLGSKALTCCFLSGIRNTSLPHFSHFSILQRLGLKSQ